MSDRVMRVSHDELKKAEIPVWLRDYCSHLLIPLNKCRRDTYFLPWKCSHERHAYEKCQYVEYVRRKALKMGLEVDNESSE